MKQLKGACIIAQSGGPTAVINSSAYGAISAAMKSENITRVLGAVYGIQGVLDDNIVDLGFEDPNELELLKYTPSSALGSCRHKMKDFNEDDSDYKRILEIFYKYDVRYFFYIGGNDSMDTCNKISKYMLKCSYECRVIGIPKTIDNDLFGTDHCPGYGSAAKYIAASCVEVYLDSVVYNHSNVTIMEIMGRNAGWLTAASAIATANGMGPDLIYLPEVPFSMEAFLKDVKAVCHKKKTCMVAVSEGIKDKNGVYISEYNPLSPQSTDAFGHTQLGGLGSVLAAIVKDKLHTKVRAIEFSLLQRCAAHCASQTDIDEAFLAGSTAVDYAASGFTDQMIAFERSDINGAYHCLVKPIPLCEVANAEKKIPLSWINETKNGLSQEFIDYALPLIGGETQMKWEASLPRFAKLKMIRA